MIVLSPRTCNAEVVVQVVARSAGHGSERPCGVLGPSCVIVSALPRADSRGAGCVPRPILARTCPDSLGAVAVSPGRGSPFGLPPRPLPLYPCRSSPSGVGYGQQGGRIDPPALVPAPRRNRALWCGGSAVRFLTRSLG